MEEEFKKLSDKINEEMKEEEEQKIIRDLVVGFLIIKSKVKGGNSYVNIIPLDSSWDGINDDIDLDAGEEIVGVIPAPQNSYKVLGLFPREDDKDESPYGGSYRTLGYEYNGVYHPEWKELLEEKIKDREIKRKMKEDNNTDIKKIN